MSDAETLSCIWRYFPDYKPSFISVPTSHLYMPIFEELNPNNDLLQYLSINPSRSKPDKTTNSRSTRQLRCENYQFIKEFKRKFPDFWRKALYNKKTEQNILKLLSHKEFYVKNHKFSRSASDDLVWTTTLRVEVSLRSINNSDEIVIINAEANSKAGFNESFILI